MNVLVISHEDVARLLPMDACIEVMAEAMRTTGRGGAVLPLRSVVWMPDRTGMIGLMPGFLGAPASLGLKVVSIFPGNHGTGYDSHQGVVMLFDPVTGELACIADAREITAVRTAAASAVATDALARPDARRLALLGYGEQAQTHLKAIGKVRRLETVTVWGRSPERAQAFAERLRAEAGVAVEVATSAQAAVAQADIVCTVTPAAEPILKGAWLAPGAHVNLVGSSFAGPAEVDSDLVVRSRFIADHREGVLKQGAEFLIAKAAGLVGDEHVAGEIGEVLSGKIPGRQSPDQITVYKSLGHIVQDLVSVQALLAIPPRG